MFIRPHSHAGWSLASVCLLVYFFRVLSDIVISLSIICEVMINSFQLEYPVACYGGSNVLAKSVPEGAKFHNTPSACGGDRNSEDFASLFWVLGELVVTSQILHHLLMHSSKV
jgi:hypothetical protein